MSKKNGGGQSPEPRPEKRKSPGVWPPRDLLKEIVFNKAGIVTQVAMAINMDRRSVQRRLENDDEFVGWFREARERNLDMSEAVIFEAITKKNLTATIFHLKCHGKSRGWIERQEVTGADGRGLLDGLVDPRKISDGVRDALMDPAIRKAAADLREKIDEMALAGSGKNGAGQDEPRTGDAVTKH